MTPRKETLVYFIIDFIFSMILPMGSYLFGLAIRQHNLIITSLIFMSLGLFWNVYYLKNRAEEYYESFTSKEQSSGETK